MALNKKNEVYLDLIGSIGYIIKNQSSQSDEVFFFRHKM